MGNVVLCIPVWMSYVGYSNHFKMKITKTYNIKSQQSNEMQNKCEMPKVIVCSNGFPESFMLLWFHIVVVNVHNRNDLRAIRNAIDFWSVKKYTNCSFPFSF